MSALAYRAATAADIDAVVALVESAYRGDASRQGWTTEADFLDGRRTGPDEIGEYLARTLSHPAIAEVRALYGRFGLDREAAS